MKKHSKEHPEIIDIEHICDITPHTPDTETICNKVNKNKAVKQKRKSKSNTKET